MTTHTPRPARPGLDPGAMRRGLGALLILAALVVAPPVALIAFVGNPVPNQTVVGGQFTDAAVIGILAAIVWAAWVQLLLVIAVEAVAAVRGGALPARIPWCGFQQHFARRLVMTASLLLAATGSMAGATLAAGPAVAAVAPESVAPYPVPAATAGPSSSVTKAEVAGLDAVVNLGTVVSPDRLGVAARATEPAAQAVELWYVVRQPHGHHHDSLWDIAERHLGDGLRWREIYDLNRHRLQPDGHRLELARLIQPGWRLQMPADATGISPERPEPQAEVRQPSEARPEPKAETAAAGAVGPSVPHARQSEELQPAASPAITDSVPVPTMPAPQEPADPTPATPSNVGDPDVDNADHDEVAIPFGQLTLGLGAVACTGLIAELARRRRRAQRFRRPGERLQRPSQPAAIAERHVHAANAELAVTDLRDALRLLAQECRTRGRALPDVQAITLNASGATLLLGRDEPDAVSPFLARDDRSWLLRSETFAPADRASLVEDGIDPYPALASLGVTGDAVLLVNLEAARTLTITGPPAETTPILHALVAELGTGLLSATAQLVLTDCPPGLAAMLDQGRVTVVEPGHAGRWARNRGHDVKTILRAAGAPDLAAAREMVVAEDIWSPALLFVGSTAGAIEHLSGDDGFSVIRLAARAEGGWSLGSVEGRWTLDPLGIDLTPQRLVLPDLERLADAVATVDLPRVAHSDPSTSPTRPTATEHAASNAPEEGPTSAPDDVLQDVGRGPATAPVHPARLAGDGSACQAPRVLVLGPVEVVGVADDGAPGRRRRATELVTYLALHVGATQHQLDEALWPGCRVSRNTRNPLVSRTRQWLGTDPAGQHYLGLVGEGGQYSLAAGVSCDWHDFSALVERGLAAGADGVDDLIAALTLVRGRPFLGVNPAAYGWAEADTQDMIGAVVDASHTLARMAQAAGDPRRARWAVGRGLSVEPFSEMLVRDAIRAAGALGDADDAGRLASTLRQLIQDLDPEEDLEAETLELLDPVRSGM